MYRYRTGKSVQLQYGKEGTVTVQERVYSYSTGNCVHFTLQERVYSYSTGKSVQLQYRKECAVTVQEIVYRYSTGKSVQLQYRKECTVMHNDMQSIKLLHNAGSSVHRTVQSVQLRCSVQFRVKSYSLVCRYSAVNCSEVRVKVQFTIHSVQLQCILRFRVYSYSAG